MNIRISELEPDEENIDYEALQEVGPLRDRWFFHNIQIVDDSSDDDDFEPSDSNSDDDSQVE